MDPYDGLDFLEEPATSFPHKYVSLGSYKGMPFVTSGSRYGSLNGGEYNFATEIYNPQLSQDLIIYGHNSWIAVQEWPFVTTGLYGPE